jgi:hypothetical protein
MNIKRILYTPFGKIVISILLGLGLATMFRKVCTDNSCIIFNGPVITDIEGKTYKYGEKCYKYTAAPIVCDKYKKIINVSSPPPKDE